MGEAELKEGDEFGGKKRGRLEVAVTRDWSVQEEKCQSGKGWALLCLEGLGSVGQE